MLGSKSHLASNNARVSELHSTWHRYSFILWNILYGCRVKLFDMGGKVFYQLIHIYERTTTMLPPGGQIHQLGMQKSFVNWVVVAKNHDKSVEHAFPSLWHTYHEMRTLFLLTSVLLSVSVVSPYILVEKIPCLNKDSMLHRTWTLGANQKNSASLGISIFSIEKYVTKVKEIMGKISWFYMKIWQFDTSCCCPNWLLVMHINWGSTLLNTKTRQCVKIGCHLTLLHYSLWDTQ